MKDIWPVNNATSAILNSFGAYFVDLDKPNLLTCNKHVNWPAKQKSTVMSTL